MGLYVQATYSKYGPHWHENLFYSHFLSLPLFLPFLPSLIRQFGRLLDSPPASFTISPGLLSPSLLTSTSTAASTMNTTTQAVSTWLSSYFPPLPFLKARQLEFTTPIQVPLRAMTITLPIPVRCLTLLLNTITQYACIRGVNLLATRTTALGVSIVLNVRKLVSLFISILVFGNELPGGVLLGAAIVFGSGALYAWEGQRRSARSAETRSRRRASRVGKDLEEEKIT